MGRDQPRDRGATPGLAVSDGTWMGSPDRPWRSLSLTGVTATCEPAPRPGWVQTAVGVERPSRPSCSSFVHFLALLPSPPPPLLQATSLQLHLWLDGRDSEMEPAWPLAPGSSEPGRGEKPLIHSFMPSIILCETCVCCEVPRVMRQTVASRPCVS